MAHVHPHLGLFSDLVPHPQTRTVVGASALDSCGGPWMGKKLERPQAAQSAVVSRYALAPRRRSHEVGPWHRSTLERMRPRVDNGASYVALAACPTFGWRDSSDFGGQGLLMTIAVDPADSDRVVVGGVNWETVVEA